MPALRCPWCKVMSNFSLQHQYGGQAHGGVVAYGMWTCTNCSRPIVGIVGDEGGVQVAREYHPQDIPDPDFPDVPEAIASDAKEAFKAFAIECWSASAAMARRALQAAAYDKGAPDGRLIDQIDDDGVG